MPSVFFHPFAGLRSSVANANGVGSSSGKNLVRNRTEGYLQQGQGYADLFSSVGVPASDATKGISALVVRDFISFSVPDHPPVGAAFTSVKAVYATYTKTSHGFTGPVSVNTAGIFIRPYWDGAVWNDSWARASRPVRQAVIARSCWA